MKRTTAMTLCVLALSSVFAGCTKEDVNSSSSSSSEIDKDNTIPVTLHTEQENDGTDGRAAASAQGLPGTRTAVGTDGSSSTTIVWSKSDAISVFDGASKNIKFTVGDSYAGKTSATFTGAVSKTADSYAALYPYQSGATVSSTSSTSVTISGVTLSSTQTATVGSFDPSAALMAGKEVGGTLCFKNVVGFVRVTPVFNCSKISLVSNNSSDVLSGTVDITLNYSDTDKSWTPSVAVSSGASDASNTVSIEGNITGNKTYYIAVLPGTLSNGFRVVLTPAKALGSPITTVIKSSTKSFEIERNSNWNLGTIYGVQVGNIMLADESVVWVADGEYLPTDLRSSAVGVVAHIYSSSDASRKCYTGLATALSTLTGKKITKPTGLVLALKNAATKVAWSTITDKFIAEETDASSMAEAYKLRDGYANTQAVYSYINKNGYTLSTDAPAFYAVSTYSAAAPANSTGWYLPSYGEWCDIMQSLGGQTDTAPMVSSEGSITYSGTKAAANINYALMKAASLNGFGLYWSSTESPATQDGDSNIRAFQVGVVGTTAYYWRATKNLVPDIRCVFAF